MLDNVNFHGEALNLVDDGVDGVAHLVRHSGVNQGEQVVLRQCFVIQNLLRNVDDLNQVHLLFVNQEILRFELDVHFAAELLP